jgi:cytochrome c biogenesis protein CcdA
MLKKIIKVVLAFSCFSGFAIAAQPPVPQKLELDYFFAPSCHVCHEVKEKIISQIEQKYKGKVLVNFRDISSIENYKLLLALKQNYGLPQGGSVPAVHFCGKLLNGKNEISSSLMRLVEENVACGLPQKKQDTAIDLIKYFFSFTPVTVVSAGLIDGINPCAFTVIVFFISFLALQGYRKSELAVVGMFFIFAVFITYLLIGLGLFSFFYSLKGFWAVRKTFNLGIGILSLIFGIMAVADFIKFRAGGNAEDSSLKLPPAVKNQIHKVIGMHYRRDKAASPQAPSQTIFKLIITALVTGFLVSILEAVCTGQMYLPTITFVLKTTNIKIKAFAYLVLYNLMFILPLFIIFLCALAGTTSEDFSRFLKKHFLATKVSMAVLFFVLGIYLIWRA